MSRHKRTSRRKERRVNKIFNHECPKDKLCDICGEEKAIFRISKKHAEGLPGNCLCHLCHEKVMEVEDIISAIYHEARSNHRTEVARLIRKLEDFRRWTSIPHFQMAIDALRRSGHKHDCLNEKAKLQVQLLTLYGNHPSCTVRADLIYSDMAVVIFNGLNPRWICHIPKDRLWGRFLEQYHASVATATEGP